MANIRRRGKHWQAQIRTKGYIPLSKTFMTKREAQTWSYIIESELKRGLYVNRTLAENTLAHDVLKRYEIEVVPKLSSEKCVRPTLKHFGKISLANINPTQLVNYRELSLLLRILKKSHLGWGI